MTQATIDHDQARAILRDSIRSAKSPGYKPAHPKTTLISDIVLGSHLTYRYILFTNLLAKSTNASANGLALQAGADMDGAFDSRSLCHKVVVDFDRNAKELAGKLGRSNEPYLNKPARYPTLSLSNAVRRGSDRTTLEKCIDVLGGLQDSKDARSALEDAIYYVMQRDSLIAEAVIIDGNADLHDALHRFSILALENSCEGESAAIISALAFFLIGRGHGRNFDVRTHPVNQAGSSSNEVLDIDIYPYLSARIEYAAEIKDKEFTYNDVDHAASKAAAAGLDSLMFVCGPRSQGAASASGLVAKVAKEKQVRVSFMDVDQLVSLALGFSPRDLTAEEAWHFIDATMQSCRVKDGTKIHILSCAEVAGLIQDE